MVSKNTAAQMGKSAQDSQLRGKQMNKNEQLPGIGNRRNRWLSGGSALAAAAASLTLFSGQAYAQNRLQTVSIAPPATVSAPSVSRLPQAPIQVEIPGSVQTQRVPATSIATRAYVDAVGISLDALVLPPVQSSATSSPPTGGAVSIIQAPAVSAITTLSTTTAPSNGDTNIAGINVAATANYFASEANFQPGSFVDVVQILGPSAIINWTTNDPGTAGGEVTFLGAGQQLDFFSNGGSFTVLNRIFTPTVDAAVRIDGRVTGRVFGGELIGGNIWFYSPGGLIIGANAVFNVGSLVLTSSNLNTIGSTFDFTGVAETDTAVVIEAGAQISALEQGSYFAVVAPRIVQGGTVDVNGSVAYVAAEQAQLTINNGLFDISVGVGSGDLNGVVHTGTTTGAASTPLTDGMGTVIDSDAQGIYMVAVPKNTAISMMVGGTIGYQPAEAAALGENGSIILSSGTGTVTSGGFDNPSGQADVANAVASGNVVIEGATFTSSAEIYASDSASLIASGTSAISSGSDGLGGYNLSITADNSVSLSLQDTATINIDGDLTMASTGSVDVDLTSTSGTLSVGGDLRIDTSARGADDFFTLRNNGGTGIGADAVAGSISWVLGGGTNLNIGGNFVLDASAQGGKGEIQNGSSTAGDIFANFSSAGSTNIGGFMTLDARALSALEFKVAGNGPGLIGNSSTAGDVTLILGGNSITSDGLYIDASADATPGDDSSTAQSNDATAGAITVNVTGGFNQFGFLDLYSQANAATSFSGTGNSFSGVAGRGSVNLNVTNFDTVFNVQSSAFIDVSTDGAIAPPSGNTVNISVDGVGTSGGIFFGAGLQIATTAGGGVDDNLTSAGSVFLDVTDGQFFADFLGISSNASTGGRDFFGDGNGRNFQGDDVTLRANVGGLIQTGSTFILSEAIGVGDTGGDAFGGTITLAANGGAIVFANSGNLIATASGGAGVDAQGQPAIAQGGDIILSVAGAGGSLNLGSFFSANTDARILFNFELGDGPFVGPGGDATAGDVIFDIDGGTLIAGDLFVSSSGTGGVGGGLAPLAARTTGLPSAGDGGVGVGGDVTFNLNGGDAIIANLTISADGFGGNGADGDFEAGTRGGRGGDAVGGAVTFNALTGTLNTGLLTISARANGVNGGGAGGRSFGSEGGDGGNAVGGNATFNLTGSAVITAGSVLVTTEGFGGRGGNSDATFDSFSAIIGSEAGGNGGNGTGGTSTFNNTSGGISFTDLTTSAAGIGGDGGSSFGFSFGGSTGAGGTGGAGTGGIATINLNQDDGSDPNYNVIANAVGGAGGGGLDSGDGGAATGGTANLAINNSVITFNVAAIDASALGGNAGFAGTAGGSAGAGGNAVGGTANLDVNGALADVSTSEPLRLNADAVGGNGADGPVAGSGANGSGGGSGGSATGGTVRIGLTGAGAALTVGSQLVALSSDATGGRGGNGGFSSEAFGGTGGSGGDATGGSLTLEANSGTTLTITEVSGAFALTGTGIGGDGGFGGGGIFTAGAGPGVGGDGGSAIGGSPTLRAIGGTITGGAVALNSFGFGGNGGGGGVDGSGIAAADGNGGDGLGGNPIIELLDGSPGVVTLGDVTITASGFGGTGTVSGIDLGGRVDIRDLSVDPGRVFSLGSLTVDIAGVAASLGGGFFLAAGSGINTIVGNQTVNVVGDISYVFDGDGQLVVSGDTLLAATGNILITHTNNTGLVSSIASGGGFTAIAGLDFIADGQSIIGSGAAIAVRAEGEAEANDLQAVSNIDFSAGRNATVNNASVTGPAVTVVLGPGTFVLNGIAIAAGGNNNPSFEQFDPTFNAAINGDVSSTGFINVTAGGNAVFAGGSNTVSDNGLTVRTGDDIIIGSGALVEAGANAATSPNTALPFTGTNNLLLDAGALARSGELLASPLTPIASIVNAGDIAANNFAAILNANAIDGTGGTISAGSIRADIVDAPSNAVIAAVGQSNDNGLLSGNCLQGNICLGSVSADNRIEIGQNSNNDVIQLIVEQAAITANDILITIRDGIVMGSSGIPTSINAANVFAIESLTGDIDLIDAVINSDQITIAAAGSLLGNGSLISANDIGITVSQDLNALLIDTGGQLTDVVNIGGAFEAEYSVPGSINVGTFNQGAAAALRVVAGGDNSFGAINLAVPQNITLIAADAVAGIGIGDVFLGTATGANNIDLTGDNVGFGDLTAAGTISASAAVGTISFGSAAAAADLTLTAVGAITGGDLSAGGLLSLNGGSIAIGAASGTNIDLTSGTNILFDSLSSPNAIILSALNGLIGGNTVAGDIDSDGDVDLVAQEIDLGNVTSGGSVSADASVGDASFGTVDAVNDITITATGTPSLTNAISGGNTSITGSSVFFANGSIGGDLALTATSGNIDGNGTVNVGGGIALDAAGNIAFGSLDAAGGDFTADAGGSIAFTDATASGLLGFVAGGSIAALGGISAQSVFVDSGDTVSAGSVTATGGIDIAGVNGISIGALTGGNAVLRAAAGTVTVIDEIDMAGLLDVRGTSVFLRSTNGLTVAASATAGTIDISVAGDLDLQGLDATGDIGLTSTGGSIIAQTAGSPGTQQITSSGGDVNITAANDFTVNASVGAANALTIVVGGLLDLQANATGAAIDALVGDLNIGSAGSLGRSDLTSSIAITTGGDIVLGGAGGGSPTTGILELSNDEFSRIFSGGDLSITAQVGPQGAGGNITLDTLDILVGAGNGTPQDGNIGTSGGLILGAGAAIDVIGVATMTNAGVDNLFALDAIEAIRVNPESGALLVQDANGGLAGVLDLAAPRIEAISDLARSDTAGALAADIDTRLGENDGAINDTGYFAAGNINFTVDDALLIQNSGDGTGFDDRRGFTAGTVNINSAGSTTMIVINGIVDSLTGVDAIAALGLSGIFDPGSTLNGCLILSVASCSTFPGVLGNPGLKNPIQDLIDRDIDPSDDDSPGVSLDFDGILVGMREPALLREDPLLDDPVTGAGNEDLWVTELDCTGVDAENEACTTDAELEPAE